jgi:alpha(1,3/1,4) fucosyltransferase
VRRSNHLSYPACNHLIPYLAGAFRSFLGPALAQPQLRPTRCLFRQAPPPRLEDKNHTGHKLSPENHRQQRRWRACGTPDFTGGKVHSERPLIKYFAFTEMPFTAFGRENTLRERLGREILQQEGILPAENAWDCDILLANTYPFQWPVDWTKTKRASLILTRPILVWTDEPRFSHVFTKTVQRKGFRGRIHVMNPYTGDLYLSNYSLFGWAIKPPMLDLNEIVADGHNRSDKIAALMTHYGTEPSSYFFFKDDKNLDLAALRQNIALAGHRRNLIDIYGRGWPEGISKEDSRGAGWSNRKIDLLRGYRFNLCMENTAHDYYCTEKIWDSIRSGCLPIYYGKDTRIYDDFPVRSFLDVAEYAGISDLLNHVESMTAEEYRERLAKCLFVYNSFLETNSFEAEYTRAILSTANRIRSIVTPSKNTSLRRFETGVRVLFGVNAS